MTEKRIPLGPDETLVLDDDVTPNAVLHENGDLELTRLRWRSMGIVERGTAKEAVEHCYAVCGRIHVHVAQVVGITSSQHGFTEVERPGDYSVGSLLCVLEPAEEVAALVAKGMAETFGADLLKRLQRKEGAK